MNTNQAKNEAIVLRILSRMGIQSDCPRDPTGPEAGYLRYLGVVSVDVDRERGTVRIGWAR